MGEVQNIKSFFDIVRNNTSKTTPKITSIFFNISFVNIKQMDGIGISSYLLDQQIYLYLIYYLYLFTKKTWRLVELINTEPLSFDLCLQVYQQCVSVDIDASQFEKGKRFQIITNIQWVYHSEVILEFMSQNEVNQHQISQNQSFGIRNSLQEISSKTIYYFLFIILLCIVLNM